MLLEELELLVPRDPQADQATLLIERGVLELLGDALERLVDGIVRVGDEQHPTSRLEVGGAAGFRNPKTTSLNWNLAASRPSASFLRSAS